MPNSAAKKSAVRRRDLERTKTRLLAAALAEFVARGFAGARTKAIARRAGVHEWMVFYCFGSKQNLYLEVMRGKLLERTQMMARMPDDLAVAMPAVFKLLARNRDVIRLFQWEALTARKGELLAAQERREAFAQVQGRLRRLQQRGELPTEADLELLWIAMVALILFPLAFPQFVQLATGQAAGEDGFQRRWAEYLTRFAQFLAAAATPAVSSDGALAGSAADARAAGEAEIE